MDFGGALKHLKDGKKVEREGWNGKGMFVKMTLPHEHPVIEGVSMQSFLVIKNVSGGFNTWDPSIADLMADDWKLTM